MTTAVSVPITLLWTQAKSLRWIFGVSLLLIPIYFLNPNQPGMYELFIQGAIELMQSGLLNPFILLSVLVGVSSAHLFGFEFSEGAGGFIQTRPISHRQLFFIKTSILVVLCGILGVLTKMVCRIPSGIHIEFVFAALYLDIAFWIATCTLLCRETVRGLLYGVPTLLLASSAIVYGFLRYSMDAIYVSGEETPLLQENLVALPVGLIGILVSPVVVLGLLSIAAHRWRFGTWRVTPISIVSIIAIVSFGVLAHYSFAQEGKVVIPNQIKSSQLRAFQETEDRFYFLELSSSRDKTRHTIQINKVDWTDPGSGIQRVLEIPLELDFDSLPEAAQGILSKATSDTHPLNYIHLWMNHNRVFAGTYIEKQRSFLYSWNDLGEYELIKKYESKDPLFFPMQMNDNRLNLIELKDWDRKSEKKEIRLSFNMVNLDSGDIDTDVGEIPIKRDGDYMDAIRNAFDLQDLQPSKVLDGNPDYRARINHHPNTSIQVFKASESEGSDLIETIDIHWSETFAEGPGQIALYRAAKKYVDRGRMPEGESLALIDFERPEEPVRTEVPFPTPRRKFIGDLEWFRTKLVGPERDFLPSNTPHLQEQLAVGKSHLLFFDNNFHRVYLWNIEGQNKPSFTGSASYPKDVEFPPYTVSPVLAPDGTIGYFTPSHGPLWLEFPALMKEGNPL